MIILDTSFIYALLDSADTNHGPASGWYETVDEEIATTPFVLAEVDHLAPRAGVRARRAFRRDLASGAYTVEWWSEIAGRSALIATTYEDLGVSLTDASLVALAARFHTTRIGTFDERHFRSMRPLFGDPAFTLLPADAV
jgi:predicted nucleic acid-binding protein